MRKSQAALEYLSTYAWALVVIAITVGALYTFDVFDFGKYLPQKCIFPSQFKCLDFSLKPSEIKAKLVNNLGEDVCVAFVAVTNDASSPLACDFTPEGEGSCAPGEFEWIHGAEKEFAFTNCVNGGYLADSRAEAKISFSYYSLKTPSKPFHLVNGKINGKVTSG